MLSHLIELRRRLIHIILVFLGCFLVFFLNANRIFLFVVSPILNAIPSESPMIATQITAPLLTPIQLAFDAALLTTCPYALIQIWRFVTPGLYQCERQRFRGIMVISLSLFILGVLFCFYGVLPIMLHFFASTVPDHVQFLPDITSSVQFISRMLLIFGLAFQVPLGCLLLVRLNVITVRRLMNYRPYVIVGAFIVGMLLTPPDVLSQVLLAAPLCLLYELGIFLAKWLGDGEESVTLDG